MKVHVYMYVYCADLHVNVHHILHKQIDLLQVLSAVVVPFTFADIFTEMYTTVTLTKPNLHTST